MLQLNSIGGFNMVSINDEENEISIILDENEFIKIVLKGKNKSKYIIKNVNGVLVLIPLKSIK